MKTFTPDDYHRFNKALFTALMDMSREKRLSFFDTFSKAAFAESVGMGSFVSWLAYFDNEKGDGQCLEEYLKGFYHLNSEYDDLRKSLLLRSLVGNVVGYKAQTIKLHHLISKKAMKLGR